VLVVKHLEGDSVAVAVRGREHGCHAAETKERINPVLLIDHTSHAGTRARFQVAVHHPKRSHGPGLVATVARDGPQLLQWNLSSARRELRRMVLTLARPLYINTGATGAAQREPSRFLTSALTHSADALAPRAIRRTTACDCRYRISNAKVVGVGQEE
jgi:hypothetical protein